MVAARLGCFCASTVFCCLVVMEEVQRKGENSPRKAEAKNVSLLIPENILSELQSNAIESVFNMKNRHGIISAYKWHR